MDNKEKVVVIFCESTMQGDLIKQALCHLKKIDLCVKPHSELANTIQVGGINIAMIDYNYISKEGVDKCWHIFSFKCDLIFYNIPEHTAVTSLSQWANLKGGLYTTSPIEHLSKCLDHVIHGDRWLPREVMVAMLQRLEQMSPLERNEPLLTRREKQILKLLVSGQSNQEIGDSLYISESTVKAHIYRLYKKMNVRCRKEAMLYVYKKKSASQYHLSIFNATSATS